MCILCRLLRRRLSARSRRKRASNCLFSENADEPPARIALMDNLCADPDQLVTWLLDGAMRIRVPRRTPHIRMDRERMNCEARVRIRSHRQHLLSSWASELGAVESGFFSCGRMVDMQFRNRTAPKVPFYSVRPYFEPSLRCRPPPSVTRKCATGSPRYEHRFSTRGCPYSVRIRTH